MRSHSAWRGSGLCTRVCTQVDKKISGLKTLISLLLNGEVMPKLLMTVIRFCVPCNDHKIKKLLLVYWEVRACPGI